MISFLFVLGIKHSLPGRMVSLSVIVVMLLVVQGKSGVRFSVPCGQNLLGIAMAYS